MFVLSEKTSDREKDSLREKILSWAEQALIEKGFEVKRKGLVNGDGISHVFDLLAEYSPLPGSSIRVGVIIVDQNDITVDYVEKMLGWLGELHSLKIILIPLRKVETKARLLAQKYGIDIVVPPQNVLSKIKHAIPTNYTDKYYLEPVVDSKIITKKIIDKTKKSLFRSSKCKFEKLTLTYYPLIEFEVELPRVRTEIEEAEVVEGKIVFDGLYGYIVTISGGALKVMREYGSFAEIPEEAYSVLRVLSEERSAELDILSARTRLDQHTLKALLVELSMHGLVEIYSDLVELKPLNTDILTDLSGWITNNGGKIVDGVPEEKEYSIILWKNIPLYKIEEILNSLNAKIDKIKTIYYPLYTALLKELSNEVAKEKIAVYNGLTGIECEDLEVFLTTPEFISRIREKEGIQIDLGSEEK